MSKRLLLTLLAVVVVLILAMVVYPAFKKSSVDNGEATLVWGGPRNISMLNLIAARDNLFSANNLTVRGENIQTGKLAMDALQSGSTDLGVLVDSNLAFAGFQDSPVFKAVAIIQTKWDDAIIYRKDTGITSPADLRGRRIATPLGTTAHIFAAFFLRKNGIPYDEVEFVNMSPPGIQAAFLSGDLEVASIWQPFRYNVRQSLESGVSSYNDGDAYRAFAVLAARNDVLENSPDKVRLFLKALKEAERILLGNLTASQAYLAREVSISLEALQESWGEYEVALGDPNLLLPLLREEGEWIRSTQDGYRNRALPDYTRMVDGRFWRELTAQP